MTENPTANAVDPELRDWIVNQGKLGTEPAHVIADMVSTGWGEQAAIDAVEGVMRDFLEQHARDNQLPLPTRVPAPIETNGPALLRAADRDVHVLASLLHPRVIVFGNVLTARECDEMIALARPRVSRSFTFNQDTGEDQEHVARTSQGMFFSRGENPLCARIEARIAALTQWPLENGEGLQVLCYGPGAEYKPHYDYFDPRGAGSDVALCRGGQRVASLVMYLNTPRRGGATTFPETRFEVAPVKGNAVFFSYDRPHPMTASLHGGAPVVEGEKWIATKWMREHRHD